MLFEVSREAVFLLTNICFHNSFITVHFDWEIVGCD